jgi:alpha-1,2-mannosyltransferase
VPVSLRRAARPVQAAGARRTGPAAPAASALSVPTAPSTRSGWARLRAYWLTPPGVAVLGATLVALVLRLYTLTRPGYLTGVTEYDDGVYLGAAIRLLSGSLPYHDFALVQPPGIALLMAPVAVLGKFGPATHAMAAARLLTVLASTACVPLAGSLVRYRGTLVTVVTCGLLAVYPDDVTTAHTLILEPWLNVCCLLGVCLAFRRGWLASPRRLLWAGVAIGFAGTVKYWAALPAIALLAVCLLSGDRAGRARRAGRYSLGVAAGFVVPVLPFFAFAPGTFIRSTLVDQAARAGTYVPVSLRLAHLTGLIDVLNGGGHFTLTAGARSMFASGGAAATSTASAGWLPFAVALLAVALLAIGYAWEPRQRSPLEWYALVTAAAAVAAVLGYSAFFYHYPAFAAPWLALSAGSAVGALATGLAGRPGVRQGLVGGCAAAVVFLAAFQASELSGLRAPDVYPDEALIPAGSCVVTDEISLAIAADRFSAARPGCPDVLDSLAQTLVLSGGVSVQGGAATLPHVVAAWQSILSRADYVWLSPNNARRIPWTPALTSWFDAHFRFLPVHGRGGVGWVYQRITP